MMGKKAAQRFPTGIPVGYSGGRLEGLAKVADVSKSGARLAAASSVVPDGTRVQFEFGVLNDLRRFSMGAEVVRQTEDGFAVRFHVEDPNHGKLFIPLLEMIASRADRRQKPVS